MTDCRCLQLLPADCKRGAAAGSITAAGVLINPLRLAKQACGLAADGVHSTL
jgi:hypothetical protein